MKFINLNKNVILNLLFIWCLEFDIITAAVFPKCAVYQQKFEKVLGYRPNILKFTKQILRGNAENSTDAINLECWNRCYNNVECSSYVYFFTTFECFGFSFNPKSTQYEYLTDNIPLTMDPNAVYFNKICLDVSPSCKSKLWPIVRIPGSSLVNNEGKAIENLLTRQECAKKCLQETEFECLSASFVVSHRNNYARQLQYDTPELDDIGQCTLNRIDKMSRPDSFRVASNDEEYIENQCIERAPSNVFCSFEQYIDSNFIYSEYAQIGLTQKECQNQCNLENRFYCQGVSYKNAINGVRNSICYLHSEDTITLGPRAVKFTIDGIYMRRVKCLNLTVFCKNNEMIVEYTPDHTFDGRLYVNSHFDECSIQGQGTSPTILKIPYGNEQQDSRCGIIKAFDFNDPLNRALVSTLVVIQKYPYIETQGDRLIKVGCIVNMNIDGSSINNEVTIGSSIALNGIQPMMPNRTVSVISNSTELPKVTIKILNFDDQTETNDVQLGETIQFVLNIDPFDTIYDIEVIDLYARSGFDDNIIQLIDNQGCPIDPSVFPALTTVILPNSKSLRANFNAFKFVDSSNVKFEVKLRFCEGQCPMKICPRTKRRRRRESQQKDINRTEKDPSIIFSLTSTESHENTNIKYSKMEYIVNNTETLSQSLMEDTSDAIYQSVISSLNRPANIEETSRKNFTNHTRILKTPIEIPLHFELRVKSPKAGESESLIYGENSSILVAGLQKDPNALCMTPGVVIIILLFWLLLQVVLMTGCCVLIKKYRKLAELEEDRRSLHRIHQSIDSDSLNRRVRWADQGKFSNSEILFAT